MRNSIFHYNKETCQYELVSISLRSIVVYCLGVTITAALMFIGLTTVYDRFTETPLEAELREENYALDKHQVILASQLAEVEATLSTLKLKDADIHQKLFDEPTNVHTTSTDKKTILLADAGGFTNIFEKVKSLSNKLYDQATSSNARFNGTNISEKDFDILNSMPTLQPIANPNLDLLVSGFGIRINPFHKGKYKHPGIDFAAARGTAVFASAPGKVIDINKSELQAGYGNSIDIDHGHGFVTRYAHLETIMVREGQKITKGMAIGTVGNSGGSIAPHLHYEVIHRGENINPVDYMIEGLSSNDYNKLITLGKKQNQSLD